MLAVLAKEGGFSGAGDSFTPEDVANAAAAGDHAAQAELRIAQAGPLAGVKGTAGLLFPVLLSQIVSP